MGLIKGRKGRRERKRSGYLEVESGTRTEPAHSRRVARTTNSLWLGRAGHSTVARHETGACRLAVQSGQRRVDHDITGDLHGAVIDVALALDARVALECAADIVLRIDDGPVAVRSARPRAGGSQPRRRLPWCIAPSEDRRRPWSCTARRPAGSEPGDSWAEAGPRTGGKMRRRRGCHTRRRRRSFRLPGRGGCAVPRDLPREKKAMRGREYRSADNTIRLGSRGRRSFCSTTTFKLYGGLRRSSIRLGMAWRAIFQSPACMSLAIRRAPRLGGSTLRLCTSRSVSLSAGISRPVA